MAPYLGKFIKNAAQFQRVWEFMSQQNEKLLIEQSRKFLLTAARLKGWNDSKWVKRNWIS
jgi:hypothetical protein